MDPERFNIECRIERHHPLLIEFDTGFQERSGRTRDYYPDVDELLALDLGNEAYRDVIIRTVIVHGLIPPERNAAAPAVLAGTRDMRLGVGRSR